MPVTENFEPILQELARRFKSIQDENWKKKAKETLNDMQSRALVFNFTGNQELKARHPIAVSSSGRYR